MAIMVLSQTLRSSHRYFKKLSFANASHRAFWLNGFDSDCRL